MMRRLVVIFGISVDSHRPRQLGKLCHCYWTTEKAHVHYYIKSITMVLGFKKWNTRVRWYVVSLSFCMESSGITGPKYGKQITLILQDWWHSMCGKLGKTMRNGKNDPWEN